MIIAAPAPAIAQIQNDSPAAQTHVSEVEEQTAPSAPDALVPAESYTHENVDASSKSQAAVTSEIPGESTPFEGNGFSADEAERATNASADEAVNAPAAAADSNPAETLGAPPLRRQ